MPGNPPPSEENENQYLSLTQHLLCRERNNKQAGPFPSWTRTTCTEQAATRSLEPGTTAARMPTGSLNSSSWLGRMRWASSRPEQWSVGIMVNEAEPAEHGNAGGFRMLHPVLSPNLTSSRPCPLSWASSVLCILRHQLDTIENHTVASESFNSAR